MAALRDPVCEALVQYRNKGASPELRRGLAQALLTVYRARRRPFNVNDFVDLCMALDVDGVRVGGMDAPLTQVRSALGPDKIVGASCYGDLQLAQASHRAGVSYIAFGGFYPSRVKKYPVTPPLEIIAQSKAQLPLPACVIGGMTQDNSAPHVEQG